MSTSSQATDPSRLQPFLQPRVDRHPDPGPLQTCDQLENARLSLTAIHIPPLKANAPAYSPAPTPAHSPAHAVFQTPPLVAPPAHRVIEPLEPMEPCASVDGRFGSTMPPRSSLSPSQRAARRGPDLTRDQRSRAAYVTYIIEPR